MVIWVELYDLVCRLRMRRCCISKSSKLNDKICWHMTHRGIFWRDTPSEGQQHLFLTSFLGGQFYIPSSFWPTTDGFDQNPRGFAFNPEKGHVLSLISHLIEGNADKPVERHPCFLRAEILFRGYLSTSLFLVVSRALLARMMAGSSLKRVSVCRMKDGRTQSLTAQSVPTLSYFWMAISSGINTYSNGIESFASVSSQATVWNKINYTSIMGGKRSTGRWAAGHVEIAARGSIPWTAACIMQDEGLV